MQGRLLEHAAKARTSSAVSQLMNLQAQTALLVTPARGGAGGDGTETVREIPADFVMRGDVVLVKTGAQVPIDGSVVWGEATVDESMLTGTREEGGERVALRACARARACLCVCRTCADGCALQARACLSTAWSAIR